MGVCVCYWRVRAQKADEVLAHTYNHIYGLSITALRFVQLIFHHENMHRLHLNYMRVVARGGGLDCLMI